MSTILEDRLASEINGTFRMGGAEATPPQNQVSACISKGCQHREVVGLSRFEARLTLPPRRFRKDKNSGAWKVMGPLAAIEGQREIEVMKRSGMWTRHGNRP